MTRAASSCAMRLPGLTRRRFLAAALLAGAAPARAAIRTVRIGGLDYVRIQDLAAFYGMRLVALGDKKYRAYSQWTDLRLQEDRREASLNDIQVWMHAPLAKLSSRSYGVTKTDVATLLDPAIRPQEYLAGRGTGTVILDPGHGGKDPGTISARGLREKDVVLNLAKRVRLLLANQGLRVQMTRASDIGLELSDRTYLARKYKADLYVSLHCNAASTTSARGIETYVLTEPGYASTASTTPSKTVYAGNRHAAANAYLGYTLQKALLKRTQSIDRGLRRARFLVLKEAPCPAVLLETGFLSNSRDEDLLRGEWYLNRLAQGIADGVQDYVIQVKKADLLKR